MREPRTTRHREQTALIISGTLVLQVEQYEQDSKKTKTILFPRDID
jgi:quercetin dioxygenase-like cupin family protein